VKSLKIQKILITTSSFAALDKTPMERLVSSGYDILDNPFKRKLTKDELLKLLDPDVIGLIAGLELLDRQVLETSNLKVISRVGSGLSNVDLKAAEDLGIKICYTPYGPTNAVAELTLGAMLSLIRMMRQMDRDLHRGQWNKRIGFQLEGKTVVIIGFGKIGRKVADLLVPFKVNILAVDPFLENGSESYPLFTLEEALPKADIITIHSSGEQCILGDQEFCLMKKDVYLLNAARGGLISESSLMKALDDGRVAGAWLDTFDIEPYNGPLINYQQVILTPHISSYTIECRKKMETEAVDNLVNALHSNPEN